MANTILTLHETSRNKAHALYKGTTAANSTALTDFAALEQSNTGGVGKLLCGFGGSRSSGASTTHETFTVPVSYDDRVAFLVSVYATRSTDAGTITVKGGSTTKRGAWRSTGDFSVDLTDIAGVEVRRYLMGPYESAKVAIEATSTAHGVKTGQYYMQLTHAATQATNVGYLEVLAFTMPSVDYDT